MTPKMTTALSREFRRYSRQDDAYCHDVVSMECSIDELEVFEMIRHINDPEHPLTLEQLNVAAISLIRVDDAKNTG